jgi:hypothetical protein
VSSQLEAKGLFAGLFDFSFSTFITLKFLRVIYAVIMGLILLGGLGFFISLLARGGAAVVAAIILVPLVTLLYLIFARIYMELIALFFRIGENTSLLVAQGGGTPSTGGLPPSPPPGDYGYGTPPPA